MNLKLPLQRLSSECGTCQPKKRFREISNKSNQNYFGDIEGC
jgi:hypothetical protein